MLAQSKIYVYIYIAAWPESLEDYFQKGDLLTYGR